MNKLTFLLSFFFLITCCELSSKPFLLEGTILNQTEADSILELSYMSLIDGKWETVIDSARVIDGRFAFEGNLDGLTAAALVLNDASIRVYLEPKEMKITLDKDRFYAYSLTGTSVEKEMQDLKKILLPEEEIMENKLKQILKSISIYNDTLSNINNKDSLSNNINKQIEEFQINKQIKDSLYFKFASEYTAYQITPDILFLLARTHVENIESIRGIYNTMPIDIRNSLMGQLADWQISDGEKRGLSRVGYLAPDFYRKDMNELEVRLSDFRDTNYVLLDFWASWCRPCLKEIPKMKEIEQKYRKDGLVVIGVSLDEDTQDWRNSIEKHNLNQWTQILSKQEDDISDIYNVESIPFCILINKHGEIVARWQWIGEDQIAELNKILRSDLE